MQAADGLGDSFVRAPKAELRGNAPGLMPDAEGVRKM
jgi:hypothetical protein